MTWRMLFVVGGLLTALPAAAQLTQERATVSAGGGTLTSPQYIVTGTLGQVSPVGVLSNATLTIHAGFWHGATPMVFTLTIKKRGAGSGVVTGPGIDCGADCAERYAVGATLDLAAAPDPCSRFVRWEDAAGQPLISPLTISANLTVAAVFEACCPAPVTPLSPADGAANQPLDATLTWQAADKASSYEVYFGASEPLAKQTTTLGLQYAPAGLTLNTAYHWRVDAVNRCGATPGTVWAFTTTANHPPTITSTPPLMVNRTYQYDVRATDPDGDALAFSLSDAPEGMTIDAGTGRIRWIASPTQIGTVAPTVTVSDGRGGAASQSLALTVTADTFTMMTVAFLEGVNLRDGATEQDPTVLSLGVGANMSGITNIILPNRTTLFTFSALATFHLEYRASTVWMAPEPTVAQIAVEDTATGGKAFEAIDSGTVAGVTWQTPAPQPFTATTTLVFRRSDGRYLKIGHMTMNLTAGTLTFAYADVTP